MSETEHATKKLTTDIAITPKVLMDKPKRNILPYPFNQELLMMGDLNCDLSKFPLESNGRKLQFLSSL